MIILDRRCILIIIVLCTSHLRHSAGSQGSGKLDSPPWPLLLQAAPGGWCWWRWRWCPRCPGRSPCRRGAGRETGQTCWPSPHRPWRESPAVSVEALRIISWCEVNVLIVIVTPWAHSTTESKQSTDKCNIFSKSTKCKTSWPVWKIES